MARSNIQNSSAPFDGSKPSEVNAAFRPLYKQIKDLLIEKLEAGEWKPGEPIPSELELVNRFGVSQGTIRKAVDELAIENVLIRRQGKGTFVATHLEAKIRHRFLRFTKRSSTEKSTSEISTVKTKSRFLSLNELPAEEFKSFSAGFDQEKTILAIKRVIEFDGTPTVLENILLPARIFEGLTLEVLQNNEGPLYGFYETSYGISMIRAEEQLSATVADPELSKELAVELGHPLLQVDRVAFTYGDKPIEYRRGLYLTEHYFYRNSLS